MFKNFIVILIFSLFIICIGNYKIAAQEASETSALDEIVVTSSKHEESKREVPTNMTVISGAEIQNSTARSMSDVMSQHGFQIYSPVTPASTQTLYIRGFGGSSMTFSEANYTVTILLNGHRTSNADLSLMNLLNIERIEIIRGPAAVQYGSSAMGGVVNIITKRGEGPLTATVEVGIGSDGRNDEKLAFSGSYNMFDYAFGFSHMSVDDMHVAQENTGDRRVVEKGSSIWKNTSLKNKYGIDTDLGYTFLENHRIGFHFTYAEIDKGLAPNGGMGGFISTVPYHDGKSIIDTYTYNYTLSYEGATVDKDFNWFVNYTHGRYANRKEFYSDVNDPYGYYPYYPDINNFNNVFSILDQIQLQLTYDNLGYFSVTGGLDYYEYESETVSKLYSNTNLPTISKGTLSDIGFYLLAKLRLLDSRLIFSAGARYDLFKIKSDEVHYKYNKFTPTIGVAYSPFEFLKIRANYSVGYSLPNLSQLLGDGTNYLPSPSLKPQESKTFEIGADFSYNGFDASVTYFKTHFKQKISGAVTDIPNPNNPYSPFYSRNINLDGAVYSGIELDLKADIGDIMNQEFSLTPYLTLTWMMERKNLDTRPRNVIPIAPSEMPDVPRLVASYGVTFDYPDINLMANLNATYFGKMYTQDWDTDPNVFPGPFCEYGGFTTVNFSISKRIIDFEAKGNLTLKVDVNNLFNQYKSPVMHYPIQSRNFYVGLVYSY
ncbi:MAG: TonB-dependent receptor [Deltaproteobacteria bacterium]|jgi:vitamin B12 transporter|nr:TonB-dependent receptor [Deltaproteobacteria bacterium]